MKLDYELDELHLDFDVYHLRNNSNKFSGVGRVVRGVSITKEKDWSESNGELSMVKSGLSWQLDSQQNIESTAYYRRQVQFRTFNLINFGTGVPNVRATDNHDQNIGFSTFYKYRNDQSQAHFTVGYDFKKEETTKQVVTEIENGIVTRFTHSPSEGESREIHSVVVQGKQAFFSKEFSIHYGARFDDYSDFGRQLSPRLGLLYYPQESTVIKLLYGQAFRAPTSIELFGDGSRFGTTEDLKPELIDTYELIWMQQAKTVHTTVTLFSSSWDDKIVFNDNPPVPEGFSLSYKNEGRAKAKGIEVEMNWQLNRWRIDFNGSYVESESKDPDFSYSAFPKWIANVGVAYSWSEPNLELYLSSQFQHDMKDATNLGNVSHDLQNYHRVDLNLNWSLSNRISLYCHFKNLFDRDNVLPSRDDTEFGVPDSGLSIMLGVNYSL
mgnify:CR=1 FL=1